MTGRDASLLLRVWESGTPRSTSVRALLLLSAAVPDERPEDLTQLSVGHRNAHLLSLRERLFGSTVDCLTRCPECADSIHITFAVNDVRAAHADRDASFRVTTDGHDVRFRLPNSADLLALEGEQALEVAERHLLSRCVLEASTARGTASTSDLPDGVTTAISRRMSEVDPQAEVLLDIACPSCAAHSRAPFDIASYLWREIESWAKGMLRSIHTIASAYGWRESDIVAMNESRRRAYLELIIA